VAISHRPWKVRQLRAAAGHAGRPDPTGSRVEQTAFFEPDGILGFLYWYAVLPFHRFIFPGLIDALKARAEAAEAESGRTTW